MLRLPEAIQGASASRLAVMVFVFTLAGGSLLVGYVRQADVELERNRAGLMAADYAKAITRTLERSLSATYALGAFVGHDVLDIEHFQSFAAKLLPLHEGVAALAIAPQGIVRDIYPLAGNEAALGHDLLNDPQRNEGSMNAIASKFLVLSGPYPLLQGGIGASGRLPVFLPDALGERRFWGFTMAVLRFPEAIEAAKLQQLEERGFPFKLWRTLPDGNTEQIIAMSAGFPGIAVAPVEVPVKVPGGEWTLSIGSTKGWGNIHVPVAGGAIAVIISTLLAILARALLLQRVQGQILEATVRQRTADLKQAQSVARLGSWVLDLKEGRTEWDEETRRIIGVGPEIPAGFEIYLARVHPDDRDRVSESRRAALAGGDYDIENRLIVNGDIRWVRSIALIQHDGNGEPVRVIGTTQDITERKLHESQWLEAMTVFRYSMHGIAITDTDGQITAVNPAFSRITGYAPEDVLGKRASLFSRDESNASWFDILWQAVRDNGTWEGEITARRKSGELYPQWISIVAVHDPRGRVIKYVGLFSDATRHKQQQSKMLAASILSAQEREQARIAHELHDNLGQMLTALNLLLANAQNRFAADAEKIPFRQGQALVGRLIEEVRTLAYRLRPAELDALGLAASLRSLVEQMHEQSGLDIRIEEDVGHDRFSDAIETCCFRVTQEALTNCIRHAAATRLSISLRRTTSRLVLSILDDGCGFDAERQLAPENPGSLGLLGMHERAGNAGGHIRIESGRGQGTRITLTFELPPMADPPANV